MKIPALIIDFEATSNKDDAQATQIGYKDIFFKDGQLASTNGNPVSNSDGFSSEYLFCKPDAKITYGSMAITGICEEDVADMASHKEVVASILNESQMYLIGHNIDYDVKVAANAGVDVSGFKAIDTLSMTRILYPDLDSYSLVAIMYYFFYDIARTHAPNAHDAGYDVSFCYLLLEKICQEQGIDSLEKLYEFSEECRTPKKMPFGKHKGKEIHEIPTGYIKWLFTEGEDIDRYLSQAICDTHSITQEQIDAWREEFKEAPLPDVMPFGKHKGTAISELPREYVEWMLANATSLKPKLRQALEEAIAADA